MTTWRLRVRDPRGSEHDVFVDAESESATSMLERRLDDIGFHARPIGVDGRPMSESSTVSDLGLVHGSLLTVGNLERERRSSGAGWRVVVVTGPDAGRSIPVARGASITVGRGAEADLHLDDPLLSAVHCRLTHQRGTDRSDGQGDGFVVTDEGSTNGTSVEGEEITEPTTIDAATYVHVGSSVLTLVEIRRDDLAIVGEPTGPEQIFPRQYREATRPFPERVDPPREPSTTDPSSGSMWWRALLPIVSGVGFAAITGRWIFLLVMFVSPVVMAFEALRRKRRRTRDAEAAEEKYRADLAEYRERVTSMRTSERARRRGDAQLGGLAMTATETHHRRLWERVPSDADFGSVAVGLGTMPSPITTVDPEGVLSDEQWGVPVQTNLLATGSLGIIGPLGRARAVARSAVMNLTATHSPADLRLSVLTTDAVGAEWGFARWLPHGFDGDNACRIATTSNDRADSIKALKQLLDTRAETRDGDAVPLPIHVVVIDGTDLLGPADLSDLLGRGPGLGVVGISIDERLAPEGLGATLTLTDAADLGVFVSRHEPRIDGVMMSETLHGVAEASAVRMAPLRSATDDDSAGVGGVCHLVEIDRLGALDASTLAERWERSSPNTVATVGMSSETPMHVDLVTDGPHGLVGGTSGSGKTEFLKTLFVSLCVNNHPDDLSIVIVDFKGGVDHDAVRGLPHVVDVATNLDTEQFKRTIAMLDAEQKRRQDLLARAGANNVVSYRQARVNRPELPPLPRLVVVVDEFGELLASDGGREQLRELESITRIGRALGLHLLLVTQNFESSLPPQIDANAGLRICLRVQKPAHSKAVLDSGIASTIADRNIGRAYARFHGRDLIEFQTARVAGRRRDLASSADDDVAARVAVFASLASPPASVSSGDVPTEETDMFALVQVISEAATLSGWSRGAVPWPAALPTEVSVQAISAQHASADGKRPAAGTALAVPVGLVDVPDQQRRETAVISARDEQVVVVGGPSAPVAEVLTTYATSLAVHYGPDDVHLYGVDLLGRSLGQIEALPHCGGAAVRNEQLALRIVRWLIQVAAERKIDMAATGSSTIWEHAAATGEAPPQIVLLVNGTDQLLSVADGAANHLAGPLTRLVSESVGVGIQVVLGGLPKLANHRIGTNIERRFVLQVADANELSALGAKKTNASDLAVPRRAIDLPSGRVVQLAQLAPSGKPEGRVIAAIAPQLPTPTTRPPHRFADVSWPLPFEQVAADERTPPSMYLRPLPVAIDTNSGEWAWLDAHDDGPVFAVAGPPKSGRSTTLAAMAKFATDQGWSVVNVVSSRRSPLAHSPVAHLSNRVSSDELGPCVEATTGPVLVLVDDLQRLEDSEGIEDALKHRERILIAVAGPPDFLSGRSGVMRSLPAITAGVLLAPVGSLDGSAIGLRRLPAEWTTTPRAGRGILGVAGDPTEIQVPLVPLE